MELYVEDLLYLRGTVLAASCDMHVVLSCAHGLQRPCICHIVAMALGSLGQINCMERIAFEIREMSKCMIEPWSAS